MSDDKLLVKIVEANLEYIAMFDGAGKEASDAISKAYKEDKVFDSLLDYTKFICFLCDRLKSGDRQRYPICSNSMYAVEQINIWMMMKQFNR